MRDELGMPIPDKIGTRQEVFDAAPQLLERGEWVCLDIRPDVTWPVRPQSVNFAGHVVWIMPITTDCYPGVAIKRPPGMSRHEAEHILYRLLSVISWRENCGVAVAHRSGGSLPLMMGLDKKSGYSICESFDFVDVICPEDEGPQVALALMREARGLNHYGYAFLSFWRVLEWAFPKKRDRVAWMQAALPTLSGNGVREALAAIPAQGPPDVCRHLFDSGRCAIAHAAGHPIINPDDPRDAERLSRELPLVREMAIRAIEEHFGIDTPSTEYRKHLYELRGWKARLGSQLVDLVLAGGEPGEGEVIELPRINVRLRDCPPYLPLEGMQPTAAFAHERGINLEYRTHDGLVAIRFRLSLPDERLVFDIANGLYFEEDGSISAAEYQRELHRFMRDYFLNGILHIWDADSEALISRLSAFLPVNCRINLGAFNAHIADADAEVERRRIAAAQPV